MSHIVASEKEICFVLLFFEMDVNSTKLIWSALGNTYSRAKKEELGRRGVEEDLAIVKASVSYTGNFGPALS